MEFPRILRDLCILAGTFSSKRQFRVLCISCGKSIRILYLITPVRRGPLQTASVFDLDLLSIRKSEHWELLQALSYALPNYQPTKPSHHPPTHPTSHPPPNHPTIHQITQSPTVLSSTMLRERHAWSGGQTNQGGETSAG